MSNTPAVSIIIPVYNAGNALHAAIESAVDQTGITKEILLVDGGSTDNSLRIIQSFGERVTLVASEPDGGVYDAINKALDRCKGEWIYILGADDKLAETDVLASQVKSHLADGLMVYGNITNVRSTNKLIPQLHKSSFSRGLYWRNTLHQQSVVYHHTLFKHFRFNAEYKVLADYDFHLLLLLNGTKAVYLDRTIAICQASGLSKNFDWSLYREELRIKKQRFSRLLYMLNAVWIRVKYVIKKMG